MPVNSRVNINAVNLCGFRPEIGDAASPTGSKIKDATGALGQLFNAVSVQVLRACQWVVAFGLFLFDALPHPPQPSYTETGRMRHQRE